MKIVAVAAGIAFGCSPIWADQPSLTGEILYHTCKEAADETSRISCLAYISGLRDGILIQKKADQTQWSICLPAQSTGKDVMLAFEHYLEKHPERRFDNTAGLMAVALHNEFPCEAPK